MTAVGGSPGPGWWQASDGNWYPPQPSAPAGPPPGPPGYYQPVGVAQGTNGLAIASLVLGIVWLYWIGSILAVIFGHIALSQIKKSGGLQGGRGMAIAGLVLGYIGFVAPILAIAAVTMLGNSAESRFDQVGDSIGFGGVLFG